MLHRPNALRTFNVISTDCLTDLNLLCTVAGSSPADVVVAVAPVLLLNPDVEATAKIVAHGLRKQQSNNEVISTQKRPNTGALFHFGARPCQFAHSEWKKQRKGQIRFGEQHKSLRGGLSTQNKSSMVGAAARLWHASRGC